MGEESEFQRYLKERHAEYTARHGKLDDLAFKTSERYDQWILTIAGGGLAVSLTFLEKFAPKPEAFLPVLYFSWVGFGVAIVAAFVAIRTSRQGIYRQIEIANQRYKHFRDTATEAKPAGEQFVDPKNEPVERLDLWNDSATAGLIAGCFFLCLFAVLNLNHSANEGRNSVAPQQLDVNVTLGVKK